MARLSIVWAPEGIMSYREIMDRPGCYLDLANGNILRNKGTTRMARQSDDRQTDAKQFVLLSPQLELGDEELLGLAVQKFGVRREDLGRVVIGHS